MLSIPKKVRVITLGTTTSTTSILSIIKMSSLRYSGSSRFYKELAELPVPASATFINTITTSDISGSKISSRSFPYLIILAVVRISYSIRDHERNIKRSVTKTLTIGGSIDSPVLSSTISQDPSEILAFLPAPSEKRHAILREVSDANGVKKRYVEVWSGTHLEASLEVTKQHGQFHTDGIIFIGVLVFFTYSPTPSS